MNCLLQSFHIFTRNYMNDVVIFSRTLKKHVQHLHKVFALFDFIEISLKPSKFYLDYLTVTLLDQQIDVLELIINAEKIKMISSLQFSFTLKILKSYLELMS